MTRRGLGAGLAGAGAFGGGGVADLVSGDARKRTTVPLDVVDPPVRNPRGCFSTSKPTPESLESLIASVRDRGILQPILVRPVGPRYQVVAGERRYLAAQIAGLSEIPVYVRELTDEEAFEVAVMENTQREDMSLVDMVLSAFEMAALRTGRDVRDMPALFLALKNGTQQDSWNLGGMLRSLMGSRGASFSTFAQTYARYLLLSAAEVTALREGRISDPVARVLTRLPESHPGRPVLLEEAIRDQLTAADVQERVRNLLRSGHDASPFEQRVRQVRKVLPSLTRLDGERKQRADALLAELLELVRSSEEGSSQAPQP